MNRQENTLIYTLAAIQFTHVIDFMILMPLGPQLMRLFGISPGEFGLLMSAYTFSAGVSGFAGAFVVDRFDRKKVLLWLYAGFVVGTLSCAFATGYAMLLAARIVTGAFGGALSAQSMAIVGDVVPIERRATAMGKVMVSFSMASVIGVPFGLWLANAITWHAPFIFLGAMGVPVIGLILKAIPSLTGHISTEGGSSRPLTVVKRVFGDAGQRAALTFGFAIMLGHFMVIPFISPALVSNVGFSEGSLAYMYFFGGVATFFSSPRVGRLADRLGKHAVFTIFILVSLIPTWLLTNMGPTPMALALCVTVAFFICANGRMVPSMALITSAVPTQARGSFMSVNSALQQIAAGVGALAGSFIVAKGADGRLLHYEKLGYAAMIISVLCVPIARRVKVKA